MALRYLIQGTDTLTGEQFSMRADAPLGPVSAEAALAAYHAACKLDWNEYDAGEFDLIASGMSDSHTAYVVLRGNGGDYKPTIIFTAQLTTT